MRLSTTLARVLYIDTECRPGHWIGGDYVSKVITAAAWAWGDRYSVTNDEVFFLTHYDNSPEEVALAVTHEIRKAGIVAGHYVRGFDLRIINGALLRGGLRGLGNTLASDTKLDLKTTSGRSLSQKNLAGMLGCRAEKIDVALHEWEGFNSRQPGFELKIIQRVTDDVRQNIELRQRVLEIGWLGEPRVWRPAAPKSGQYHA